MKNTLPYLLALASAMPVVAKAGTLSAPVKNPPVQPVAEETNFGRATLGAKFSEDLQSGYLDVVQGLLTGPDHALFLSLRGTLDDSDQQIFSSGLGFRTLLEDPGIVVGANVFYDYIDSPAGNSFNQLGLGAEVLSKWVDARFNYYLPESGRKATGSFTSTSSRTSTGGRYASGGFTQRDVLRTTTTTTTQLFEQAIEGWNAEVGFLVPGVNKYFDLRLFAGAYGYDNPGGGRYEGFKGRVEARVTRNVTLDLEYWDDKELVGGNWVAGVRFSSAFDLGNLFQGKNPFRGNAAPAGSLRNRLDEMVIRSHRIMTGGSAPQPGDSSSSSSTDTIGTTDQQPIPVVTTPPTKPSTGGGEKPPK
ncbi:MAG: inverse autotransporter beta domain-containing protein [Verrucomicrobiaceae bacterium]|nr:inverse autotransporter beta domain-containing protein [Verrucomicrobiaceae bacterium]